MVEELVSGFEGLVASGVSLDSIVKRVYVGYILGEGYVVGCVLLVVLGFAFIGL